MHPLLFSLQNPEEAGYRPSRESILQLLQGAREDSFVTDTNGEAVASPLEILGWLHARSRGEPYLAHDRFNRLHVA